MSLEEIMAMGLYGLVFVFAIVFTFQRLRWRISGRGYRPRGVMLGNALHQLQSIAEPQIQYVIEEKQDDSAEDEEDAGPDDPVRHLHRQARKIRRGKGVERLTAFLK